MPTQNYIGGKWVGATQGATFESRNPATGEILGELPRSTVEDVHRAVDAAAAAFEMWRKTPAPKRGEILFRAAHMFVERKEELSRLVTQEMGKVIAEGRGDVQEMIDMTYYMAGEGRRLLGFTAPSELQNKAAMALREPVGVVASITPWNFPLAIPSWKIMPALIAGNTVVFKPAEDTSVLATRLVEILEEAGLPGGVLNLVIGYGSEIGDALVTNPKVDLISFTGSTATGKRVAVNAAQNLKRVSLEMGGKNAIIVMDDADLDLAVEGIIWSAFGTSGQRCTAASRLIVQKGIRKQLTERLLERIEKLRLGNGLNPETNIGPVINQKALDKIHSYTEIGKQEGARLLTGGQIAHENGLDRGYFYCPTLFDNVNPNMRIAQEEIFGPVTAIIEVATLEEAIKVNNATTFGLSSSIFTSNVNAAFTAIRDIASGLVYINAGTIGAEIHLPFGGTRGTGNGHREAGMAALEVFTEWKTVFVDYSGKLQRAQID